MKKLTVLAVSVVLAASLQAEEMSIKQEGIKYIKMLGKELKTNMQMHMKADKTGVEAAKFCSEKAESIAKEVNAKLPKGVSVRRTALKTRNDKYAPDATDIKVMEAYKAKAESKTLDSKDIQVVEVEGATRVYKALTVQKVCLKCHGAEATISDDIKTIIKKAYPKDMATGFKEGDFRGVTVSEIKNLKDK